MCCLTVALQLLALSDGAVFLSDYDPLMLAFFTHKAGFPPHEQEVKRVFSHTLLWFTCDGQPSYDRSAL